MNLPPDAELARLLRDLFTADELQRFLRTHYRDIADELPTNVGAIPLASAAAEAFARHNLLDDALFARLHASRAHCTKKIASAARACRNAPHSPPPGRLRWLMLPAGVIGAAGITGLLLARVTASGLECAENRCGEQPYGIVNAVSDHIPALECPEGTVRVAIHDEPRPLCVDRTEVTRGVFCSSATAHKRLAPAGVDRCTPDPSVALWSEHPIAMVGPDEAEGFCAERGLRLLRRREFVQLLVDELKDRSVASLLPAINLCDADCHAGEDIARQFVHHDGHATTSPVGTYSRAFASRHGLDDMFGNLREIVRDGPHFFGCGSSYLSFHRDDLQPENCLSPDQPELPAGQKKPNLGFRCAGTPGAAPAGGLSAPVAN